MKSISGISIKQDCNNKYQPEFDRLLNIISCSKCKNYAYLEGSIYRVFLLLIFNRGIFIKKDCDLLFLDFISFYDNAKVKWLKDRMKEVIYKKNNFINYWAKKCVCLTIDLSFIWIIQASFLFKLQETN